MSEAWRAKLFPWKCPHCNTEFSDYFFGAKCPNKTCNGDWLIVKSYSGVPDGRYQGERNIDKGPE